MIIPNVHNNWDRLKYVWLGDVWPKHFYDDLKPEIRDAFYQITEWTKEDLNNIQKKLEQLGVQVDRPYVDGPKEIYLDLTLNSIFRNEKSELIKDLPKPPITPRDANTLLGNNLVFGDLHNIIPYKTLLSKIDKRYLISASEYRRLSGASLVKLGKDLVIDFQLPNNISKEDTLKEIYQFSNSTVNKFSQYRWSIGTQGGHVDACFMPLREGLLLASRYYKDYELLFPGWETINLSAPTYAHHTKFNGFGHRLHIPGFNHPPHLNKFLEDYCSEWIGNYTETFFEVNILVIDERNILCMGNHESLFEELDKRNITPHVVPFRTRSFWDGGLHCVTLDIIRDGELRDYYPDRNMDHGIYKVASKEFNFDHDLFMKEYHEWTRNR